MTRAVFLDRDGVLNPEVLNPSTGQYESPYELKDFRIYPFVPDSLRALHSAGYLLFIVSNQPGYAKGKASMENLKAIADKMEADLLSQRIEIARSYYCFHHPEGVVPEYSGPCKCRKPSPFFLQQATKDFSLNLNKSWMLGDRFSDIECGKAAGTRTILVGAAMPKDGTVLDPPDYAARNLAVAAEIIVSES